MFESIPSDQQKAVRAAILDILSSLEVSERMKAIEALDGELWTHLYGDEKEASLTEAHKEAMNHLLNHWLAGKDPYSLYFATKKDWEERKKSEGSEDPYNFLPAELIALTEDEKAELRALFSATKIEEFRFTHEHGLGSWTTTCTFQIGDWRGRAQYRMHPTRDDGMPERKEKYYQLEQGANDREISLVTGCSLISSPLRADLARAYVKLIAFDVLHRGQRIGIERTGRPFLNENY